MCRAGAHESGHQVLVNLIVDESRSAIARGTHRSLGIVQNGKIELPAADSVAKCILDDTADIGVPPGAAFQFELENAPLKDFSLERRSREGDPLFFGSEDTLLAAGAVAGLDLRTLVGEAGDAATLS